MKPTKVGKLNLKQTANDVMEAHRRTHGNQKGAMAYAIWCGRKLLEVRRQLTPTKFFGWIRSLESRGLSRASAYRYLGLVESLPAKTLSTLPATVEGIKKCLPSLPLPAATLSGCYRALSKRASHRKEPKEINSVLNQLREITKWTKENWSDLNDAEFRELTLTIQDLQEVLVYAAMYDEVVVKTQPT